MVAVNHLNYEVLFIGINRTITTYFNRLCIDVTLFNYYQWAISSLYKN